MYQYYHAKQLSLKDPNTNPDRCLISRLSGRMVTLHMGHKTTVPLLINAQLDQRPITGYRTKNITGCIKDYILSIQ